MLITHWSIRRYISGSSFNAAIRRKRSYNCLSSFLQSRCPQIHRQGPDCNQPDTERESEEVLQGEKNMLYMYIYIYFSHCSRCARLRISLWLSCPWWYCWADVLLMHSQLLTKRLRLEMSWIFILIYNPLNTVQSLWTSQCFIRLFTEFASWTFTCLLPQCRNELGLWPIPPNGETSVSLLFRCVYMWTHQNSSIASENIVTFIYRGMSRIWRQQSV